VTSRLVYIARRGVRLPVHVNVTAYAHIAHCNRRAMFNENAPLLRGRVTMGTLKAAILLVAPRTWSKYMYNSMYAKLPDPV
jgi:hypothetical protein